MNVSMTVNGEQVSGDVEPAMFGVSFADDMFGSLLDDLRQERADGLALEHGRSNRDAGAASGRATGRATASPSSLTRSLQDETPPVQHSLPRI